MKKLCAIVLILIISLCTLLLLTGCDNGNTPEPDELKEQIHVSSVEELLESIAPDADLFIEPGYYNLTEFLENVQNGEEGWNDKHPYVKLRECHDGTELVIVGVEGLTLSGSNEDITELVTEPRYATVINFENCQNISMKDLTMGHTETGDCMGSVLGFDNCQKITLNSLDLYGCGVNAIHAENGTGTMSVSDSFLRECSGGPLYICDGNGAFEFRSCSLVDSDAGGCYVATPQSSLAFYDCIFGDHETSCFMFLEDITTENCTWGKNFIYPEYGFDEEEESTEEDNQ